jgi:hypothetical protein
MATLGRGLLANPASPTTLPAHNAAAGVSMSVNRKGKPLGDRTAAIGPQWPVRARRCPAVARLESSS